MVRSHVLSTIFLALVSANVIQASFLSGGLFNALPSFLDLASLPRFGELSHNFLSQFSDAASSAFGNFRNYFDDFRLGLGQRLNIPPRFRLLNHFATAPQLFPLFGTTGGAAGGASAASAATSAGGSSPGGVAPLGGLVGDLIGGSRLGRSANAGSTELPPYAAFGKSSVDDVASIVPAPALTIRGLEDLEGSRLARSISAASDAISDAAFEESAPSVDDVAPIVPAPALPLAGLGGSRLARSAVEWPVRSYAENNYDESAASVAATNAAATEAKQTVTSH